MSSIPLECVNQYACVAADINFNLENLRSGFWQLTIDGLSWGAIYALVPSRPSQNSAIRPGSACRSQHSMQALRAVRLPASAASTVC